MSDTDPSPVQETLEYSYQEAFLSRKDLYIRRSRGEVTNSFLLDYQIDLASLWSILRIYRDKEAVRPLWETADLTVTEDEIGVAVNGSVEEIVAIDGGGHAQGLEEFGEWINADVVVEVARSGTRRDRTTTKRVPVVLPASKLLQVHSQLDDVSREVGLLPDPDASFDHSGQLDDIERDSSTGGVNQNA